MSERWDRHFLQLAVVVAHMSKDPNTQVGAVIVGPDREVRSTGFNGLPRALRDTPERLNDRETKLALVVHAEMNAIVNAARIGVPLKGCGMYIAATDDTGALWGGPGCTRCVLHMMQAGIIEVVTYPLKVDSKWRANLEAARDLLGAGGLTYREVLEP